MGLFDEISREWDNLWKPKNTNQFTGAVGGSVYSETPGIGKYNTGGDNFTQGIGDWFKNIKMPWDNTPSQPSMSPTQPLSYQPKIDNNVNLIDPNAQWTPVAEPSVWASRPPLSPAAKVEPLSALFNVEDKLVAPSISDEDLPNVINQAVKIVTKDKDLWNVVGVAYQRGVPPPAIDEERLRRLTDPTTMGAMWNFGYKAPQVLEPLTTQVQNLGAYFGSMINIDDSKLNQVDYDTIQSLITDLGELAQNPDVWKEMMDKEMSLTLDYQYSGADAFGKPTYTAKWDMQSAYKTKAEKEAEAKAKQKSEQAEREAEEIAKYWSPEAVAERNRRRQESADWSDAQAMQGWTEFYDTFNRLKLPPLMDEYFNTPTMFNELRRQWKTKGGDWQTFLNNYDFKGEFNKQSPYRRGERPGQFAPVMRSR